MVFVGSGSSPTFDKDPDQEKLYYSLPYNLRNVTASTTDRVSEPACFGAAPALGFFYPEPAPAPGKK